MSDISDRLHSLLARLETSGAAAPPSGAPDALEDEALVARVRDSMLTLEERARALRIYVDRHRTDLTASPLMMEMLEGSDLVLAHAAMDLALPFDSGLRRRLIAMLDDPRVDLATHAAEALGRRKERSILAKMVEWTLHQPPPRRLAGLRAACWILPPPQREDFLQTLWDSERAWTSDDDRLELASWMATPRGPECVAFLRDVARQGGEAGARAETLLAQGDVPAPITGLSDFSRL